MMNSIPARSLFDLGGRVALVTGAGRGLGRDIAKALALHGARVVVAGRTLAPLEDTAKQIEAEGGTCMAVAADVTDRESLVRASQTIAQQWGPVTVLVNNAGINPHYASAEKTEASVWDEIMAVNLRGAVSCCDVFGPGMLQGGEGCVVNISSVGGHVGLKRQTPYCASKGALELYTRSLAADWADRGVRVNSVAYGYFETDLTAQVRDHPVLGPRLLSRIPMGRFGRAAEVGAAVVFLAAPSASYITGHSLLVDGGWTAT